ncbi:MAG: hypothetical protein NTY19_23875 [Planctomycetota bacterium]|nr:hypothetical protein [Planctomycetota bacterium]
MCFVPVFRKVAFMNKKSRKKRETDARRRASLGQIGREATASESRTVASISDADRFGLRLLREIRRLAKSDEWLFDPDGFGLVAPDGCKDSLSTAYLDYLIASAPDRGQCLEDIARYFVQGDEPLPARFEDVQMELFPVVHRRSQAEVEQLSSILGHLGSPKLARANLAEHLTIGLAYERDETVRFLSMLNLGQWGIEFRTALALAEKNLLKVNKPPFARRAEGVHVSMWNHYFGAARLLLTDDIRSLPVKGDHIAMMPHQCALIVTGTDDLDGLLRMATWREPPVGPYRPVGGIAFRLSPQGWVPWLPPEDHPAYMQFWRLQIETLVDAHGIYAGAPVTSPIAQVGGTAKHTITKEKDMKERTAPNWDAYSGQRMMIPFFVYGRDDLDVGPLDGFCRGHGAISGEEQPYQDILDIYTSEGVYYNIVIDTRLECVVPQFFINEERFFYPIVECHTMCGGVPVVDPATGRLRTPLGG